MYYYLILFFFIVGYLLIAFEHPLKIDKAAPALFTAVLLWTLLMLGGESILPNVTDSSQFIEERLVHNLGEISGILFFLLGAMTLVELVDAHGGFDLITDTITSTNKRKLLWILCLLTFFMSAALDNLTTSIIMAALLRKIIHDREDLWLFAGMIILAANAGGAWSPIGDVTTIMLWIGKQVSAANIMAKLFLPSLVCLLVPLFIASNRIKGSFTTSSSSVNIKKIPDSEKKTVMYFGVGALLFVPIFKTLTHLPPFMGMLLGLSVVWFVTEIIHRRKPEELKKSFSIVGVLQKVDTPSILFFLGILLAVAALQVAGHLNQLSKFLDAEIGNVWVINSLIGIFSAIVDNVPLVAGAIGMYSFEVYPKDHIFWELLAYCAGTGGSILIIGSAAGVAMMGILRIDFIWYLKKISWYALIGYASGIFTFLILNQFI
ncbi:MAG: Na+/H+ antiporter NhaD/arsenite permease-like protein [Vicingaceae bacterium]|jgi:Na+/H+ antiporter NhaD/arsenite permease-like protein